MPNCFSLTRKSDPEAGSVSLVKIDEEMCVRFLAPVDPVKWHCYWYDIIGFALACGKSFEDQRARSAERLAQLPSDDQYGRECEQHITDMINWLDANFISDAWYSNVR